MDVVIAKDDREASGSDPKPRRARAALSGFRKIDREVAENRLLQEYAADITTTAAALDLSLRIRSDCEFVTRLEHVVNQKTGIAFSIHQEMQLRRR